MRSFSVSILTGVVAHDAHVISTLLSL